MPRRNKHKDWKTGKGAEFFSAGDNNCVKPECVGCAFAGYGNVCATSDGACLITPINPTDRRDDDGGGHS